MAPNSIQYQILHRVVERLIPTLRSACRRSMQKRMLFINKLIFTEPSLLLSDQNCSLMHAWETLKTITAIQWVERIPLVYPGVRSSTHPWVGCLGPTECVGIRFFRSNVFILRLLYAEVLGPREPHDVIPTVGGATFLGVDFPDESDHSDTDNIDDIFSQSNVDHGEKIRDQGTNTIKDPQNNTHSIRSALQLIQSRVCKRPLNGDQWDRRTSFTPEELIEIVGRALTTQERLTILIMATTGLRIGGLCRLRTSHREKWAKDIPADALSTVEKGNVTRIIPVSGPVRMLLARWFREDCPSSSSTFVFPGVQTPSTSSATKDNCVSTSYVWNVVRKVLERAGVRGSHAHPHTFRHTFVSRDQS